MKRIHLVDVMAEVFRRKGYKVQFTEKCGEDGNGLILNDLIYVEVWKHSLKHFVEVEATMNLAKCMQNNSIYKGIFISLGDFKPMTKGYCHKNVIECLNCGQVIAMCKEAQKRNEILQLD